MHGIIFDIDHFAAHDGPGIRTTVYFKGCPLHCIWCHSPESQKKTPEILYMKDKCTFCGKCVSVCPEGLISITRDKKRNYKRQDCILCGKCLNTCPTGALELSGKKVSATEVLEEIKENILFYKNSGGGVTLTGGEVLFQPVFAKQLLKKIKQEGIHTIVETSGRGQEKDLLEFVPFVDDFYYDLKIINPEKHYRYTGMDNKKIINNLRSLSQKTENIVVRIPLIPEYTDQLSNIKKIYHLVQEFKIKRVHLLPYNTGAPAKYEWLQKEYIPGDLESQSQEYLNLLKEEAPEEMAISVIN
ncbi:MAG: glycyl-radical enzyme activating protein [Halanaerobiaceae bacterium]